MNEFVFGDNKITIRKGGKALNDYLLFHNNIQIKDELLFKYILDNISNEIEAKNFINCFINSPNIKLENDKIETIQSLDKIKKNYQYCVNCNLKNELKEFLFIAILRCDIDNICYPPPFLNGCIRIFTQILLIFSYKFNWKEYTEEKFGGNIANFVSQIGFDKNRDYFKKIYKKYLENSI